MCAMRRIVTNALEYEQNHFPATENPAESTTLIPSSDRYLCKSRSLALLDLNKTTLGSPTASSTKAAPVGEKVEICKEDYEQALQKLRPSVSVSDLEAYRSLQKQMCSA